MDSNNGPGIGGDRPIGAVAGNGGPIRSFALATIGKASIGNTSTTPPVAAQLSKPELQTVTQAATPLMTQVVPLNALKSAKGMQDKPREEAAAAAAVAATPADAEDEFTRLCEQVENIPSASDDWDALCAEFRGGPEKPAVAAATQPPKANDPDEFDKLCAEIISTPPATAVVSGPVTRNRRTPPAIAPVATNKPPPSVTTATSTPAVSKETTVPDEPDEFTQLCAEMGAAPASHAAPTNSKFDKLCMEMDDNKDDFETLCVDLGAAPAEHVKNDAPASTAVVALDNQAEPAQDSTDEFAKLCEQLEASADCNDEEFAKVCEAAAESNDAEFAKFCEDMGATAPEEVSAPPTKRAKT
jgi:hypothetical protein